MVLIGTCSHQQRLGLRRRLPRILVKFLVTATLVGGVARFYYFRTDSWKAPVNGDHVSQLTAPPESPKPERAEKKERNAPPERPSMSPLDELKPERAEKEERDIPDKVQMLKESDFPPEGPSPYYFRWNESRPDWASKPFFLRSSAPVDERSCLVHIGKTAGSTIGCTLGFQLHCPKGMITIARGILPTRVTNIFHNGVNDCFDNMAYYIFAVRNPLERMRSAFVYERPKKSNKGGGKHYQGLKKIFLDCPFKTINDLAELGLKDDGNASSVCRRRAQTYITGAKRYGFHNYYNYHYYVSDVPANVTVAVLRTEHLVEDWNSVEALMGGSLDTVKSFPHRNQKKKSDSDRYLSQEARALLCHGLCNEIQIYKSLLQKAVNLNPEQVQTSLDELHESCPAEALKKSCPRVAKKKGNKKK